MYYPEEKITWAPVTKVLTVLPKLRALTEDAHLLCAPMLPLKPPHCSHKHTFYLQPKKEAEYKPPHYQRKS